MDFSERKSLLGALCVACDWLRKCYGFFREEKGGSVACPQGRAEEKSGSEIFIYMVREILRVERSETPASQP